MPSGAAIEIKIVTAASSALPRAKPNHDRDYAVKCRSAHEALEAKTRRVHRDNLLANKMVVIRFLQIICNAGRFYFGLVIMPGIKMTLLGATNKRQAGRPDTMPATPRRSVIPRIAGARQRISNALPTNVRILLHPSPTLRLMSH